MAIDLRKQEELLTVNLEKLSVKKGINLDKIEKHVARVVVDLDISGSTSGLFSSGAIQDAITLLLPVANKFDDNGELEAYVFNEQVKKISTPMTINNYENYVKDVVLKQCSPNGGTRYAPSISRITKDYDDGSGLPTYVLFVTDGANCDQEESIKAVIESSSKNIFFMFIGVGSSITFTHLKALDDIPVGKSSLFAKKRPVDNSGFLAISDLKELNSDDLYSKILEQYLEWGKVKGIF